MKLNPTLSALSIDAKSLADFRRKFPTLVQDEDYDSDSDDREEQD